MKELIPTPSIGDVIQCCDPTCKHEATVTMFQTVRFNHGESVDCAECHGYDVQRKVK